MARILHIKPGKGEAAFSMFKEIDFKSVVSVLGGRPDIHFCEDKIPEIKADIENFEGFREPTNVAVHIAKEEIPQNYQGSFFRDGYYLIRDLKPKESIKKFKNV